MALLAIWSVPETIAFRHVFLIGGFIASLALLRSYRQALFNRAAWPFWVFLGFYLWLLVHLFFLANNYADQFDELRSLWMRCLLATPLGLALGLMLTARGTLDTHLPPKAGIALVGNTVILLILIGFSGNCLISGVRYALEVWRTHQLLNYDILYTFYKNKPPFVIGAALALPLAFVLIIRAINHQMSRWWILASLLVVALSLFSVYFSNTKNGVAIFTLTLLFFLANLLFKLHWSWRRVALGVLVLAAVLSLSSLGIKKHLEKNTAWPNLIADIKMGVDIDHQNHWKNRNVFPLPANELGNGTDGSTYERTAWFTAGVHLLFENPLGFGLIHHSFGSLALAKWPEFYKPVGNLRGATHSGWLDMALGVGIPGILLIWIPLFAAWYRSLFQEGLWFSYVSWTIPIMGFAYLTTEVAGQHFTELLFFMTAFFCGLTLRYPKPKPHVQS